jgi:hypothetical protein
LLFPQKRESIFERRIIMPGGDGTGPAGFGPMTGRAAGFCAGYGTAGYANPMVGRGFGMGRGLGRRGGGRRWNFNYPVWQQAPVYAQPNPQQELTALKQQAEYMQESLKEINQRIGELESEK